MKWEYKCLAEDSGRPNQVALNELGEDEWELVGIEPSMQSEAGITKAIFYLKRQKKPDPK